MSPEAKVEGVVDSHCHLQSIPPDERERALDAARERGVRGFLVPAIRLSDADLLLDLCERHDDVWCALGAHPHEAETWADGDVARLEAMARERDVVAIGECGLDFFYDHAPRETQEAVMREQWSLAQDLDLPVVVHNRDSNDRMSEIFLSGDFDRLDVDFHSFAGGLDMAKRVLARSKGPYLGFSGMVTFKRADNVREVLPVTPRDRLLVETDSPYLAPVPYRGRQNQPAYVVEVLLRLAQELNMTPDEASRLTTDNFHRLFPKTLLKKKGVGKAAG